MHGTPRVIVHLNATEVPRPIASVALVTPATSFGYTRSDLLPTQTKRRLQTNISPFLHELSKLLRKYLDSRLLCTSAIRLDRPGHIRMKWKEAL